MSAHDYIKFSKKIALKLAIWPKKKPTIIYKMRTIFTISNVFFLLYCLFYNSYTLINDLVQLSKSLYMTSSVSSGFAKSTILFIRANKFWKVREMINIPSFVKRTAGKNSERSHFKNTFKKIETYYWVQVNLAVSSFFIYPFFSARTIPMDFPYFNNGPFYYPFYIFQTMSLYFAAISNFCVDLLTVGFISIAADQLMALNQNLIDTEINVQNLPGYSAKHEEKFTQDYLKACCIHYSDIEIFVQYIMEVFSVTIFTQLCGSVVSICNSGIMMTTLEPVSVEAAAVFLYTVTMVSELGLYCWFGNYIYMESLEVSTSCYMSLWYQHGVAVKKSIFILMERTKRPLQIKTMNVFVLSFGLFITILKFSYSYFTLLNNYGIGNN